MSDEIEKHEPRKEPDKGEPPEQSKSAVVSAIPFENGRDSKGRFAVGNAGGPGSPVAASAIRRRQLLDDAIQDSDIKLAVFTLRKIMLKGKDDVALRAAKELLDRAIGVSVAADVQQQLAELSELVHRIEQRREQR